MFDTSGLTASPGETIRSDGRALQSSPLPTLSIDLRTPPTVQPPPTGSDLEVRGLIGEGGMGRVLLARQRSLERDVAVKTVKSDASDSARNALLAEGVVTGQLEHPSIVPVHALGLDTSGWPALVMKRVEGVSWDALLADPAHPGWEGWEGTAANRLPGHLQILISVCNALHFAHSRGVVHRDIKPQNVLIGRFGDVYLADWGVAGELGSTSTGVCGTPAFLAPEMASAGVVDARTDVYLLGATLHTVLTGLPRHPGATITESLVHAQNSPPFAYGPEVPPELAALANQACGKEPAQRPPTARAFRDELTRYLRHRDAVALGEKAAARLREAQPLLQLPEPTSEQRARLERLLAESRFGLEQSLAQCSENPAARGALAEVEQILEERRRRADALEAEARERDPRRGKGWRTGGLVALAVLAGVMVLAANELGRDPSPGQLLIFPTAMLVLLGGGAVVKRKSVLATKFNRHATGGLLMTLGTVAIARAVGFAYDVPAAVQFTRDAFIFGGCTALLAIAFFPWAWVPTAAFFLAGLLCTTDPANAVQYFSYSSLVAMVAAAWGSWRESRT